MYVAYIVLCSSVLFVVNMSLCVAAPPHLMKPKLVVELAPEDFATVEASASIELCTKALLADEISADQKIGLLLRRAEAYIHLAEDKKAVNDLQEIVALRGIVWVLYWP